MNETDDSSGEGEYADEDEYHDEDQVEEADVSSIWYKIKTNHIKGNQSTSCQNVHSTVTGHMYEPVGHMFFRGYVEPYLQGQWR